MPSGWAREGPITGPCFCCPQLTSRTPWLYSSNFWQLLLTFYCYLTVHQSTRLDTSTSFGMEEKKQNNGSCLSSWKRLLCANLFSVTLFWVMKTELIMTLLVVQTILPTIQGVCQICTIYTKTHCNLAFRIAVTFQDTSQPPWLTPEFLLSLQIPFLPVYDLYFHSSHPKGQLGNYQRALRAGWLPFTESSQQICFSMTQG